MKSFIAAVIVSTGLCATDARAADDFATRLSVLEDRMAIEQLVTGDYPRALDEVRYKDYAALFTADGELVIPGLATLKGPDAIYKFLSTPGVWDPPSPPGARKRPPSPLPKANEVKHIATDLSYTVNGTSAIGGAYFVEITLVGDKPQVLAGRYRDELRKVNGHWKFSRRTILLDVPPTLR